jgi:hypothetical protein
MKQKDYSVSQRLLALIVFVVLIWGISMLAYSIGFLIDGLAWYLSVTEAPLWLYLVGFAFTVLAIFLMFFIAYLVIRFGPMFIMAIFGHDRY